MGGGDDSNSDGECGRIRIIHTSGGLDQHSPHLEGEEALGELRIERMTVRVPGSLSGVGQVVWKDLDLILRPGVNLFWILCQRV